MKTTAIIVAIIVTVTILFSFTNVSQDNSQSDDAYATVTYSTNSNRIFIFYGGGRIEERKFKSSMFDENDFRNVVVDVLNELHAQGYEVNSTNHFAYYEKVTDRNIREYNYTLKKITPTN